MCALIDEGVRPLNENTFGSGNEQPCDGEDCRHRTSLKYITENGRKIYHEMCQPMMVMQGYLELVELGKYDTDVESMKQILATVMGQLQTLQGIQMRLKDVLCHKEI